MNKDKCEIFTPSNDVSEMNIIDKNCPVRSFEIQNELLQALKKLRESETQLKSLHFILQQEVKAREDNEPTVLNNRKSLQHEIQRLKNVIDENEFFLRENDNRLLDEYKSTKENKTSNVKYSIQSHDERSANYKSYSLEEVVKSNELRNDSHFEYEQANKEVKRLKQHLSETRFNYENDRSTLVKHLKSLEITTVNAETNWKCLIKDKQLSIEDLSRKNSELQGELIKVKNRLKSCKKSKQKIEQKLYEQSVSFKEKANFVEEYSK